jgi:hypothetical protein
MRMSKETKGLIVGGIAAMALALPGAAFAAEPTESVKQFDAKATGKTAAFVEAPAKPGSVSAQLTQIFAAMTQPPAAGGDLTMSLTGPAKGAKIDVATVAGKKTLKLTDAAAKLAGDWTVTDATTDAERSAMVTKIAETLGYQSADLKGAGDATADRPAKK